MDSVIIQDIKQVAEEFSVDPRLIYGFVTTESGGNKFAMRYEPAYRYLWDCRRDHPFRSLTNPERTSDSAPPDFSAQIGSRHTEWIGQQASWGPMQIMGAVARELGFKGFFPELCGADGIRYGVQHLLNLHKRFGHKFGMEGTISAYNAGTPRLTDSHEFVNQEYVDKVLTNRDDCHVFD